jgi:hypothetical protein
MNLITVRTWYAHLWRQSRLRAAAERDRRLWFGYGLVVGALSALMVVLLAYQVGRHS